MIAKILKPRRNSSSVLSYNEKKYDEGNADLVAVRNIDDFTQFTINETFRRYEENLSISARTRNLSFHMTLGPGENDPFFDREQITEIVDKLMASIGFQNQPYVIYEHHDIDRGHYHICSTRVDEKGKFVDYDFMGKKMNDELGRLAKEMGFTVGAPERENRQAIKPDKSLVPGFKSGETNVVKRLEALYRRGLSYPVHSFQQMQAVMRGMNVRMTARKNKSGGYNILLRGLDKKGNPITPFFSMRREMKVDGMALLEDAIKSNQNYSRRQYALKVALGLKNSYCMMKSGSAREYVDMLSQLDVFCGFVRDERSGKPERVVLTDLRSDSILDTGWENEIHLDHYLECESNGHWEKEGKKKGRRLTAEEKDELSAAIGKELQKMGYLEDAPEYASAIFEGEQGILFPEEDNGFDITDM